MTEHIINFAIGLEDDKIIANIEKTAEKKICDDIQKEVLKRMFMSRYYLTSGVVREDAYSKKVVVDRDAIFTDYANELIMKCISDNKELIIERAADKLAESFKRTKAYKEAMEKVLDK